MKSNKIENSPLETECLFGEEVELLDEHLDLIYCKLITDNYIGWIKKDSLGEVKNVTHRVLNKRTFIYENADPKSNTILHLPMGSQIEVKKIESGWAKTIFITNKQIQVGYVPSKHIVKNDHVVKDWVSHAEQLIGVPYRWGGRDTIGIDCSALLQLSYQTYGEIIPRNTSQQVKCNKKIIDNINKLKRGCVVFWEGHVGIMINNTDCIHANAFHMKTTVEPLDIIIKRIKRNFKIIKMMDFN